MGAESQLTHLVFPTALATKGLIKLPLSSEVVLFMHAYTGL